MKSDRGPEGYRSGNRGGSAFTNENASTHTVYNQMQDQLKGMFPQRKINLFEESDLLNEDNLLTEEK
jgi:hypothetical protein